VSEVDGGTTITGTLPATAIGGCRRFLS